MKTSLTLVAGLLLAASAAMAQAAEVVVPMNLAESTGVGAPVGTVRIVETPYGLAFYPSLSGLPAGLHGFHVHENGSCAPGLQNGVSVPALAAGGHFDPLGSKHHGEPWGDGHLGDLPPLYVMANGGAATNPVLAPRLKLADIQHRALMLHAGGDNHSDHPAPLGGGGARMVCGVIPEIRTVVGAAQEQAEHPADVIVAAAPAPKAVAPRVVESAAPAVVRQEVPGNTASRAAEW